MERKEKDEIVQSTKNSSPQWSKLHSVATVHPAKENSGNEEVKHQTSDKIGNNEDSFSKQLSPANLEWGKIQGLAAIAPELEKHRLKVGVNGKKLLKKVTVHQAVRQGLVEELESLLEECSNQAAERDSQGISLLHNACRYNQASAVDILLKYDADKNGEARYGFTPLHVCAKFNGVEATKVLIKHGANINARDCKQKTPLHVAARRGNVAVIKVLLDSSECDVNSTDEDKLTPLHEATAHKHQKAVQLLVKHHANIFAEDVNNMTAFLFAASEEMKDILDYFLKTAFEQGGKPLEDQLLHHVDNEGNSALHLAVVNSRFQVAEFLLEKGANVENVNSSDFTPLHIASGNGDIEMVELLLAHGAHVNVTDRELMTPCHRAALQNKHKVINILMKQGADINSKTRDQFTPLLLASSKGHMETVQFLLTNGAQIAETDFTNKTVLHVAVEFGHYPVIMVLLKEKSCTNLMEALDFNDQSCLHYAAKNGNTLIVSTLIKHGIKMDVRDSDGKTPLHVAAEHNNDNVIDTLFHTSQTELNDGDDDGKTPLMLACQAGNFKSVKTLLALGADILIRDEDFCTALILSAREGYANIVKLLLDNYGEINQSDKIKNTALHMACINGHVDCIQVLLRYHADVTMKNSYGKTPLELAVDNRQTEAAVALLRHSSWRDSMNVRDSKGFTPMSRLIQSCPEAAYVVFDNCVEYSSQKKDDPNFTVKFDYTYIDPGVDDPMSKKSRYFAPNIMTEYKREDLLSHILVQSILMKMWVQRGFLYFYINFLVYFTYLAMLQLYCFFLPKITTNVLDDIRSCPLLLNSTMLADPAVVAEYKKLGEYSNMPIKSSSIGVVELLLFIMIIILALNQVLMALTTGWRYFTQVQSYLTWTMLVSTIFFLVPFGYYPCVQEWRAGWISCTLCWLLFMDFLRGFNFIGLYFIMFGEVLKTLLKVSFILVIYLMAFATAFFITLSNTKGLKQNDIHPLTTFSMMLGELNYVDNFTDGVNEPFTVDGYFIMLIFFLVMPLALMNFLTGIAVGDIATVQSGAYLSKISLMIEKCYIMEIRFPRAVQRKWYKATHVVYPNKPASSAWQKIKRIIFGIEEDFVKQYLDKGKGEDIDEKEHLKTLVKKQTSQIRKLHSLQKQQQDMMKQMADHLHMEYKLDTFSAAESDTISRMGH